MRQQYANNAPTNIATANMKTKFEIAIISAAVKPDETEGELAAVVDIDNSTVLVGVDMFVTVDDIFDIARFLKKKKIETNAHVRSFFSRNCNGSRRL